MASVSLGSMPQRLVDWKVFTAWVETKGPFGATVHFRLNPRTGNYGEADAGAVLIPEVESAPLVASQNLLDRQGVYSEIQDIQPSETSASRRPDQRLAIQRLEDIDAVISSSTGFTLAEKTRKQIERYLHLRHTTASEVRAEYLGWLESRRAENRRGRNGEIVD